MELSRETVKRIKGLIVFAALVVACLWKYDVVVSDEFHPEASIRAGEGRKA